MIILFFAVDLLVFAAKAAVVAVGVLVTLAVNRRLERRGW